MPDPNAQPAPFVLVRSFAAPPPLVWRTWTEPALLARWYKPNPMCQTTVLEHGLHTGGLMVVQMRFGEMPPSYERWLFQDIEAPRRLQWKQSMTDAAGNPVGNPRMPDWPRVMLTTIELQAQASGTLQRLTWQPHEATPAEIACFAGAAAHLDRGWVGGFDNLGALLGALVDG